MEVDRWASVESIWGRMIMLVSIPLVVCSLDCLFRRKKTLQPKVGPSLSGPRAPKIELPPKYLIQIIGII